MFLEKYQKTLIFFPLVPSPNGRGRGGVYGIIINMNNSKNLSRALRKNQTPQEAKLWALLRNKNFHNLKFKRQYPIGNYIVDFICIEKRIIIEIDGGQHNFLENIEKDNTRSEYFSLRKFKIIRFWNNEIDNNIEGVYKKLEEFLDL